MILNPCCTSTFPDDHYFEEESGYDFQAYPSYFAQFEDHKVVNDSIKWETQDLSDLNKFKTRLLASVATVNVRSYGAKGDGKSDDTKVHTLFNISVGLCISSGAFIKLICVTFVKIVNIFLPFPNKRKENKVSTHLLT